jgi:hypothetical protein
MNDPRLAALRDLIQDDVNQRGLARDPERNLLNACPDDFQNACHSLAAAAQPALAIVTGFFIPTATPPAAETDGPLGAVFLARALTPLGFRITLLAEPFCTAALAAGLSAANLSEVRIVPLPETLPAPEYRRRVLDAIDPLTHLLAIERVGPSHSTDRCHTMRGRDVTDLMSPAHYLFEGDRTFTTLGIGDGGNEIGMGKVPRDVIERNIPQGGLIACRIPTDHLIVCGISNWGAYALAQGISLLRDQPLDPRLFEAAVEHKILQAMVDQGPLVDGVLGRQVATVDGVAWDRYGEALARIGRAA